MTTFPSRPPAGRRRTPSPRPDAAPVRARLRGFTLLEILLAMTLLVVAAALTVPALVRPTATELRTATGTVVAGLRRARDEAVSRGETATLTLDLDGRRFTVSGVPGSRSLPQRVALNLFTARSEVEKGNRGRIRFFPDGSSTGGRITLRSDERSYFVDVDWLTGQVRVHAGDGDDAVDDARVELRS